MVSQEEHNELVKKAEAILQPKKLELTKQQIAEMANLKAHYPFRIVYGAINDSGDCLVGAVMDMRQPNKLVRQGYTVFTC